MSRKYRVTELNPKWHTVATGERMSISFDCPEADGGCQGRHRIPLGPNRWTATGEFDHLRLTPSVKCSGGCQMHITIDNGQITFCSDSKSGPDWSKREG